MADFCTYLFTLIVQVLSCMQPIMMVENTVFLPVKYCNMPQFVSFSDRSWPYEACLKYHYSKRALNLTFSFSTNKIIMLRKAWKKFKGGCCQNCIHKEPILSPLITDTFFMYYNVPRHCTGIAKWQRLPCKCNPSPSLIVSFCIVVLTQFPFWDIRTLV